VCQVFQDRDPSGAGTGAGDEKIRFGHNSFSGGPDYRAVETAGIADKAGLFSLFKEGIGRAG
jgi:hypothetical protein